MEKIGVMAYSGWSLSRNVPLVVIGRGFLKLTLILSPVLLLMLLFVGTMAGGSPASPGVIDSFLIVFSAIFLAPAGLVVFQIVTAKLFDGVLRIVPLSRADVSWGGLLFSSAVLVICGNIFLDDLYQFKRGNYTISVVAFVLNVAGLLLIVATGNGGGAGTPGQTARWNHRL